MNPTETEDLIGNGSVADQHNNPLNVKVGPATQHWIDDGVATVGDAAQDGGHFLRFSSPLAGMTAGQELLRGPNYKDLPLEDAMRKWSGKGYGADVAPGLDKAKKVGDLGDEEQKYLVQSMAARERGGAPPKANTPIAPVVPPFNDLAKSFDAMMPQADFDKMRENYYYSIIAPKLADQYEVQSGWEQFKAGTERQPLLNSAQRMLAKVGVGALEFARGTVGDLKAAGHFAAPHTMDGGPVDQLDASLKTQQDELEQIARREGIDTDMAKMVGSFTGQIPGIAASFMATGPLASAMAIPKAAEAAKTIEFLNKVMHGGMAFSTLQAVREQTGSRLVAGLKGFGEGALWETGGALLEKAGLGLLSLPKYLRTASPVDLGAAGSETLARDVAQGNPIPEAADKAAKDYITNQADVARQEMRPSFIQQNLAKRGVTANVADRSGQVLPLGVKDGEENVLVNQINAMVDKGGSLQSIEYHPADQPLLAKFMGAIRDKSAAKYEYAKRLMVPGQAEQVAAEAQKEGFVAQATTPDDVQIEGVPTERPLPEGVRYMGKQDTADPLMKLDMYSVKLPSGGETSFILRPGQDLRLKISQVLNKFAAVGSDLPLVSRERAIQLVKQMGGDPATADLEAIQKMDPDMLTKMLDEAKQKRQATDDVLPDEGGRPDRLKVAASDAAQVYQQEVEARTREAGVDIQSQSALEEKLRLSLKERAQGKPGLNDFPIPLSEQGMTGTTDEEVKQATDDTVANPNWRMHQFAATMVVPEGGIQRTLGYNADGMEFSNWQAIAAKIGSEIPPGYSEKTMPGIIYQTNSTPGNRYHELVHAGLDWLGLGDLSKAFMTPEGELLPPEEGGLNEGWLDLHTIAQAMKMPRDQGGLGDVYGKLSTGRALGEAFAYASQAVHDGDQHLLKVLGEWNDGPKNVIKAVNSSSRRLMDIALGKVDSMPIRIVQRGLQDLINRTDKGVSVALRRAAQGLTIQDPYWDYGMGKWALRESSSYMAGDVSYFNDAKELLDELEQRAKGQDGMPGLSFFSEVQGVRGPIKAGGPPRTPPMPVEPPTDLWKRSGWEALRGIFEPLLPWAAAADKRINGMLEKSGTHVPIYKVVKDLMEAQERVIPWKGDARNEFGSILAGTPDAKLHDYFEALTRMGTTSKTEVVPGDISNPVEPVTKTIMTAKGPVTQTVKPGVVEPKVTVTRTAGNVPQDVLDRFKLDASDAEKIKKVQQFFLDKIQTEQHIPIMEYLGVGSTTGQSGVRGGFFQRLRNNAFEPDSVWPSSAPGTEGFWEDAVRNGTGHFDPTDTHLGKFGGWLIDQTALRQIQPELRALDTIVNRKSPNGQYVLGPMRYSLFNLARYTRGIPDTSQQIINSVTGTLSQSVSNAFERMNQYLPKGAQLPTDFGSPQQLMSKWLLFSYAAGAGSRPAFIVRDAMAAFLTSLPVLGPAKFFSGMAKTLTRAGWEAAEAGGAHLGETNFGEMYGDVFQELPIGADKGTLVKLANMAVQPMRWGNDAARTLTYNGEYDATLPLVQQLRDGKINQADFMKQSSVKFLDEANISRVMPKAIDPSIPAEEIARRIALDTVQLTQWPYLRGSQPALLRTGAGRLFGQYGTWPLNYLSFLGRMTAKMAVPEIRSEAVKAAATWVGVNYAISGMMENMFGIDASSWLYGSPAVYEGGPAMKLGGDLMASMGDTDEARKARADLLTSPHYLVPGYTEWKSIISAMNDTADPGHKDFLKVLGFRPIDGLEKDKDVSQWVKYQMGQGSR